MATASQRSGAVSDLNAAVLKVGSTLQSRQLWFCFSESMKVVPIEIAEKVEKSIAAFLAKEGGGLQAKFTRFIDLGGRQVDLYAYPRRERASPACVIRLKSTQSDEQEDCIQFFVDLPTSEKQMEDVLVSPKADDLPNLCDRIVAFLGEPLLAAIRAGEEALPEGATASESEEKSALSKAVE